MNTGLNYHELNSLAISPAHQLEAIWFTSHHMSPSLEHRWTARFEGELRGYFPCRLADLWCPSRGLDRSSTNRTIQKKETTPGEVP